MSIKNVEIQDSNGNVYYPHTDADVVKYGDTTVGASLSERVRKSTVSITYYVNTTGSDSNDGLTSGTAFKTIQKAIDSLPQIINHTVIINVASGTYNEILNTIGFDGRGTIDINGGTTNVNAVNYIVNQINVKYCTIPVTITGITANIATDHAFKFYGNNYAKLISCVSTSTASSYNGIYCGGGGTVYVNNCVTSNKVTGIVASQGAILLSDSNGGNTNTLGIASYYGATITKNGTQPSGTTNEVTGNGGVIR